MSSLSGRRDSSVDFFAKNPRRGYYPVVERKRRPVKQASMPMNYHLLPQSLPQSELMSIAQNSAARSIANYCMPSPRPSLLFSPRFAPKRPVEDLTVASRRRPKLFFGYTQCCLRLKVEHGCNYLRERRSDPPSCEIGTVNSNL